MFNTRAKAKRQTRRDTGGPKGSESSPASVRKRTSGGDGMMAVEKTPATAKSNGVAAAATAAGPASTKKKHHQNRSPSPAPKSKNKKDKDSSSSNKPPRVLSEKEQREMNEKMRRLREAKLRKKEEQQQEQQRQQAEKKGGGAAAATAAAAAAVSEAEAPSPESFIGLRIRKFFPGYGWYCGTVDHVKPNPRAPWRIV